ncbi:hypothetical protein ACE1B6_07905 [Aerosakkonemataceae cyanobacterium BLCC-F154]|uniref:Uncharacterized protein n=1 Tax=Floridaenema fluviatile BLCC-F154 TaxID=3153640 RepID=A0ABV4YAP2_9CYAN
MNYSTSFNLKIEEPWIWEGLKPPDDPLNELSDLEIGLRLFCFEWNHRISLEVGDAKKDIFLDPDIVLVIEELPNKIAQLSKGKKVNIDFPESYLILELVPLENTIDCHIRNFGYSTEQKSFPLNKSQVLEVLTNFVTELINKAVAGGYIKATEGEEFLQPIYQNRILPQNI